MEENEFTENKRLIEINLDRITRQICFRVGLGLPDWDMDRQLREAIQRLGKRRGIKRLSRRFDKYLEIARAYDIPTDRKFDVLFKLSE